MNNKEFSELEKKYLEEKNKRDIEENEIREKKYQLIQQTREILRQERNNFIRTKIFDFISINIQNLNITISDTDIKISNYYDENNECQCEYNKLWNEVDKIDKQIKATYKN